MVYTKVTLIKNETLVSHYAGGKPLFQPLVKHNRPGKSRYIPQKL